MNISLLVSDYINILLKKELDATTELAMSQGSIIYHYPPPPIVLKFTIKFYFRLVNLSLVN